MPLARLGEQSLRLVDLAAMGSPDTVGGQPGNLAALAQRAVARGGQTFETADDAFGNAPSG